MRTKGASYEQLEAYQQSTKYSAALTPLFFTSDTHFGHSNIIKYCRRPFESVAEMDEELVRRWNAVVPENGIVWHLGDIGKSPPGRLVELIGRLNGWKGLVIGNHDRKKWGVTPKVLAAFDRVEHYAELLVRDPKFKHPRPVTLCHYPFETWNSSYHGSWTFHGHCHGALPHRGLRFDVGVDGHDGYSPAYTPWSWDELAEIMVARAAGKEQV